jgi:hypothetical protein
VSNFVEKEKHGQDVLKKIVVAPNIKIWQHSCKRKKIPNKM